MAVVPASSPLYSIFMLRDRMVRLSCRSLSSQAAFDLLFNAIHASLSLMRFFHIRKHDETELLAFDLDSIPFVMASLKELVENTLLICELEANIGPCIPSTTYRLVTGQAEVFDDVLLFRSRWREITKINKHIARLNGRKNEKTQMTRALNTLRLIPAAPQVFVAIDFETFECDHGKITEIGLSLFHSVRGDYTDLHILIKEFLNLRNGRYVADNKDNYDFGTSIVLAMSEAKKCLAKWLLDATAVIGHGMQEEKRLLRQLLVPSHFEQISRQAELFDTQVMFKHLYPQSSRSSLAYILDTLEIEYAHLHNAGNDARYSLMAFLKLHHRLCNK